MSDDTDPRRALARPSDTTVVPLASGRRLEVEPTGAGDVIRIRAAEGQCVLTVTMTDAGPVLQLSGAAIEIASAGRLDLACEDLRVRAARSASIEVGGDLTERVAGTARREARSIDLEAAPGGVTVKANDDVRVNGERVLLNSDDPPMPLTWEEHQEREQRRLLEARTAKKG